jgi:hypothetical protein
VLAWDRGGFWQDPSHYPHKVKFEPVTSVPYWDERCGRKFASNEQFPDAWREFWDACRSERFRPRDYILENLTLERGARHYLEHVRSVSD